MRFPMVRKWKISSRIKWNIAVIKKIFQQKTKLFDFWFPAVAIMSLITLFFLSLLFSNTNIVILHIFASLTRNQSDIIRTPYDSYFLRTRRISSIVTWKKLVMTRKPFILDGYTQKCIYEICKSPFVSSQGKYVTRQLKFSRLEPERVAGKSCQQNPIRSSEQQSSVGDRVLGRVNRPRSQSGRSCFNSKESTDAVLWRAARQMNTSKLRFQRIYRAFDSIKIASWSRL